MSRSVRMRILVVQKIFEAHKIPSKRENGMLFFIPKLFNIQSVAKPPAGTAGGMWAISVPVIAEFIGFIGLNNEAQVSFPAPFTPTVEVGWKIAFEHWRKGYATEWKYSIAKNIKIYVSCF